MRDSSIFVDNDATDKVSSSPSGSVPKMIAADIRFHEFLYGLAGNPLIAPTLSTHLTYTQRAIGEVLVQTKARTTSGTSTQPFWTPLPRAMWTPPHNWRART